MTHIVAYIAKVQAHPNQYCQRIKQLIRQKVQPLLDAMQEPSSPYTYDAPHVKKLIRFIGNLRTNVAGDKVSLTDWQLFLISLAYGFRYKEDGRILFSELFLFIAKKNGKTTLVSALALWEALTKPAAQVFLVATVYQQTALALNSIVDFIHHSPIFADALAGGEFFINNTRAPLTIVYYPQGSKIVAFPETNLKAAQGYKPDLILFDEIASYKSAAIIQKLASGQISKSARRYYLTTAETSPENPGRSEYNRAISVLEGRFVSTNYLPILYELDPEDSPENVRVYEKANPSLDITIPTFRLLEDRDRARQSPVDFPAFQAYHLNIWSRNTLRGISEKDWSRATAAAKEHPSLALDEMLPRYPCVIGADLSKVNDWTALTRAYWIPEIRKYLLRHRFYIPESMLANKMRSDSEQLELWVRDGYVIPTVGGDTVNYDYLVSDLKAWTQPGNVKCFAYDPYASARLLERLDSDIPELATVPFEMSWRKTGPANRLFYESLLRGDILDDNPVMAWMAGCVEMVADQNNNLKFQKIDYRTSTKRIDGLISSSVAIAVLDQWRKDNEGEDISTMLEEIAKIAY